jgi:hypothetical protein
MNDWKKRAEKAEAECERLRGVLAVTSRFAPRVGTCRACHRPYPQGYVCSCGCDNSIPVGKAIHKESA